MEGVYFAAVAIVLYAPDGQPTGVPIWGCCLYQWRRRLSRYRSGLPARVKRAIY